MRQLVRLDRCRHQGVMEMVPAVVRVLEVDLEVADPPHLGATSAITLAEQFGVRLGVGLSRDRRAVPADGEVRRWPVGNFNG